MNNIAERFERKSNNEFIYFLFIAKGSCGEIHSMLLLANELKKLESKDALELYRTAEEISKMFPGLIKTL